MTESTDNQRVDKDMADEQQLEEYLKGDSSVSRQYRQLPGADVPPGLDRLVLRQAEDAVKKHSTARPAWVRWTAPLAVAASAVFVLSIVLEHGVRDSTVQEIAAQAPRQEPAPTAAELRKRVERKAEQANTLEEAAPAAPAEPIVVADPPPPPPQKIKVPQPSKIDVPSERVTNAIQQTTTVRPWIPQPAPASAPLPVPPPETATGESIGQSIDQSADVAAHVLQSASAQDSARSLATVGAAKEQEQADPEAWLKEIRQLRKDNKQEQADLEWRRFRVAFPDYEVAEKDTAREAKK